MSSRTTTAPDQQAPRRRLIPLEPDEALRLLATVEVGRIVFTQRALPAIRPVNHLVADGLIIIRTRSLHTLSTAVGESRDPVVAYEADQLDPLERTGWSVVVTGYAHQVTDAQDVARYGEALVPWIDAEMDEVVSIVPQLVSGFRLA